MSRILMVAPSRLSREIRNYRLNNFMNINRDMAIKAPATTSPKCQQEPMKRGCFPSGGSHAIFDDMPKPEGDFMKAWSIKNTKYNVILLSGILVFIGSIFLGVSSGHPQLYMNIPDYPYTEDEMEEFAKEEERRQEEKEAREQRKQDVMDAKELKVRRRKSKEAMTRELELMQKDLDQGLDDQEMAELIQLAQERGEFDNWEKEELKRLAQQEKEREKIKKEKEKAKLEQQKQREKERKEREKMNA